MKLSSIPLVPVTLPVGLALFASCVDFLAAQVWQTVADFQYTSPVSLDALAKDAAGNLYAAINTSIDPQYRTHAQIRKSSDHAATWTLIEDLASPVDGSIRVVNLGTDPAGRLYALGYVADAMGRTRWIVRRSAGGGSSWTTADDFALPDSQTAVAQGFTADAAGNVYVVGYAEAPPCPGKPVLQRHWLVRRSRDGGVTWSTIDDFGYHFSATAAAVLSTSQGLFVAGSGWNGKERSGERWLVRKGTADAAGGFRWQTVDEFQLQELGCGHPSLVHGLGLDGQGNLYAVGRSCAQTSATVTFRWVVRRASGSGTDWTVVDTFQLDPVCFAVARGVAAGTHDGVYVVGQALHSESGMHWIVRHSATGNAGTWSVCDNFRFPVQTLLLNCLNLGLKTADATTQTAAPGAYARGCAILCDADGVFAGGSADVDGGHAIVRKLETSPASH